MSHARRGAQSALGRGLPTPLQQAQLDSKDSNSATSVSDQAQDKENSSPLTPPPLSPTAQPAALPPAAAFTTPTSQRVLRSVTLPVLNIGNAQAETTSARVHEPGATTSATAAGRLAETMLRDTHAGPHANLLSVPPLITTTNEEGETTMPMLESPRTDLLARARPADESTTEAGTESTDQAAAASPRPAAASTASLRRTTITAASVRSTRSVTAPVPSTATADIDAADTTAATAVDSPPRKRTAHAVSRAEAEAGPSAPAASTAVESDEAPEVPMTGRMGYGDIIRRHKNDDDPITPEHEMSGRFAYLEALLAREKALRARSEMLSKRAERAERAARAAAQNPESISGPLLRPLTARQGHELICVDETLSCIEETIVDEERRLARECISLEAHWRGVYGDETVDADTRELATEWIDALKKYAGPLHRRLPPLEESDDEEEDGHEDEEEGLEEMATDEDDLPLDAQKLNMLAESSEPAHERSETVGVAGTSLESLLADG